MDKTLAQMLHDTMMIDTIEYPSDTESFADFAKRIEKAEKKNQLGDTLVLFVVRELAEPSKSKEELVKRMDRAAEQLLDLAHKLNSSMWVPS